MVTASRPTDLAEKVFPDRRALDKSIFLRDCIFEVRSPCPLYYLCNPMVFSAWLVPSLAFFFSLRA